jgi:TonB family protein
MTIKNILIALVLYCFVGGLSSPAIGFHQEVRFRNGDMFSSDGPAPTKPCISRGVRGHLLPPKTTSDLTAQSVLDKDVDFGPYMGRLQHQTFRHWRPPNLRKTTFVSVTFNIARDGKISNPEVRESSNWKKVDQAALDAIIEIEKFDPLPNGSSDSVNFQMDFERIFQAAPHK